MRLRALGLGFAYGTRQVLEDVTFALEPGKVVGLVGPNGAGKTTLLRVLAGLLPAPGELEYDGVPLAQLSSRERASRRAYVAQDAGEPFPYRVDEVVAMGAAHRSRFFAAPAKAAAVHQALAAVGAAGLAERRYDQLSGGERQLVLLARALVQESALLLLDEPASHLDLKHRSGLIAALRHKARQGAAILWSMHELSLAGVACDEVLVLWHGRLAAQGRPEEVLTAERLSAVYEVPLCRGSHPLTGAPTVELDPRAWA